MCGGLGLHELASPREALDVVCIGMSGNDHFAGGQVEVHAANQIDDFIHSFQVADVDEEKFAAAVDEVDIHSQAPPGLVVHFDDVRKQVLPRKHGAKSADSGKELIRDMIGTS